jgi:hypothetical protein
VERSDPADGHEPPTNEIPRLSRGASSDGQGAGDRDAEPPTKRWRPLGRGER